jgi:hypothetical protein
MLKLNIDTLEGESIADLVYQLQDISMRISLDIKGGTYPTKWSLEEE